MKPSALTAILSIRNIVLFLGLIAVTLTGAMYQTHLKVMTNQSADRRRAMELEVSQLNRQIVDMEGQIAASQRPHILRYRIGQRLIPPRDENIIWVTERIGSRPEGLSRRLVVQSSNSRDALIP